MAYLMAANWLSFKQLDEDVVEVEDGLLEKKFEMSTEMASYLQQMDGKTPDKEIFGDLPEDVQGQIILEFSKHGLLRENRFFLIRSWTLTYLTIWIPKMTKGLRLASKLMNLCLMLVCMPLAGAGVYLQFHGVLHFVSGFAQQLVIGMVMGLLMGVVLHELGHLFATLAYGGRVYELGIYFNLSSPGAYTLCNTRKMSRFQKIQVTAAGVEVNLCLIGLGALFALAVPSLCYVGYGVSTMNEMLSIVNWGMFTQSDGMSIVEYLLGVREKVDVVKRGGVLLQKERMEQYFKRYGIHGYVMAFNNYILLMCQILLPLLFILNIVVVIGWFVG